MPKDGVSDRPRDAEGEGIADSPGNVWSATSARSSQQEAEDSLPELYVNKTRDNLMKMASEMGVRFTRNATRSQLIEAIGKAHAAKEADKNPGQKLVAFGKHHAKTWDEVLAIGHYCNWVVETYHDDPEGCNDRLRDLAQYIEKTRAMESPGEWQTVDRQMAKDTPGTPSQPQQPEVFDIASDKGTGTCPSKMSPEDASASDDNDKFSEYEKVSQASAAFTTGSGSSGSTSNRDVNPEAEARMKARIDNFVTFVGMLQELSSEDFKEALRLVEEKKAAMDAEQKDMS